MTEKHELRNYLCYVNIHRRKTYWPKDQPPCAPHQFLLGARQSRRAIARYLSRREQAHRFNCFRSARPERIPCAYPSRSSQPAAAHLRAAVTSPRIAPASPAITTAHPCASACAPEVGRIVLLAN